MDLDVIGTARPVLPQICLSAWRDHALVGMPHTVQHRILVLTGAIQTGLRMHHDALTRSSSAGVHVPNHTRPRWPAGRLADEMSAIIDSLVWHSQLLDA
jgi:hypothetical protein